MHIYLNFFLIIIPFIKFGENDLLIIKITSTKIDINLNENYFIQQVITTRVEKILKMELDL